MTKELEIVYDHIKEKSNEIYSSHEVNNYKELFEYFIEVMGYGVNYRHKGDCDECCSIQIEDRLFIQAYCYENEEKAIKTLTIACEKNGIEWGILLHHKCIALINSNIDTGDVAYKNNKVVFNIKYSRPKEKAFLKYFTYDNLIRKRNTCFFRDIIIYRNTQYSSGEKSWNAYLSGLRRFFDYIVDQYGAYEKDIYSRIKLSDLEDYIKKAGKVKSDKTVKNYFFYIKDFMIKTTKNDQFSCGAGTLCNMLKEETDKYAPCTVDIYKEKEKLKKLLRTVRKRKNASRNEILLLLILSFGMERSTLCKLQWKMSFRENSSGMMEILINDNWYVLPTALANRLKAAEKEKIQGANYVLGTRVTMCKKQLPEESISTILNTISDYDSSEEFYKRITVGTVRKNLLFYLLDQHYDLLSIMQMLEINPVNLSNYIDKNMIKSNNWHFKQEINKNVIHPMEQYINDIV
ncbi:hypothetical protein [Agathobacter sp.]